MKICFISLSSTTNQDGASLSMLNVANELADRGNHIIVVVTRDVHLECIKRKNIKIIVTKSHSMRVTMKYAKWSTNAKFFVKACMNRLYAQQLYTALKEEDIDLIHINGLNHPVGAQIANKLHVPYVWHIRQLMEEDLGQRLFGEKRVYRFLDASDAVIAISHAVRNKYQKKIKTPIDVVYNGMPIKQYYEGTHTILNNQRATMLLPGRIDSGKGQMEAVMATKILLDWEYHVALFLVGNIEDMEYLAVLQDYIKTNKLEKHVFLREYVPDLLPMRRTCDIGLTCSKKEAFGRVTIENQLAGLLAIGADTGGTVELITDGENGFLYRQGNPKSLAEKVAYAIKHKDVSKKIAVKAREKARESYSIKGVADHMEEIYMRVLSERN